MGFREGKTEVCISGAARREYLVANEGGMLSFLSVAED